MFDILESVDAASLPSDSLLSPSQAATLLGVSEKTLENWREGGPAGPPCVKYCDGTTFYRLGDLRRFVFDLQAADSTNAEEG